MNATVSTQEWANDCGLFVDWATNPSATDRELHDVQPVPTGRRVIHHDRPSGGCSNRRAVGHAQSDAWIRVATKWLTGRKRSRERDLPWARLAKGSRLERAISL